MPNAPKQPSLAFLTEGAAAFESSGRQQPSLAVLHGMAVASGTIAGGGFDRRDSSPVGKSTNVIQQQAAAQRAEIIRQQEIKNRQRDLNVKASALSQEQATIKNQERQLQQLQAKLTEAQRKPLTPQVYVNRLISEYSKKSQALQTQASKFNERVGSYNAEAKGLSEQYQIQQAKELKQISPGVELKRTPKGTLYSTFTSPETLRKRAIAEQRVVSGTPLKEQFGLEASEATRLGSKLEKESRERALSGKIGGLPEKYALQKETLKTFEQKRPYSSTGPVSSLGLTVGERKTEPVVRESFEMFQKPTTNLRSIAQRGFEETIQPVGKAGIEALGSAGETYGKAVYGTLQKVSELNPYKLYTVSPGSTPKTPKITFGLQEGKGLPYSKTTERQFGSAGRTGAQVAPLFAPGGWGVAGAGLLAAGSESLEEAAVTAGTGVVGGALFRGAPTVARYGLTFLPAKAGKVSKALQTAGGVVSKGSTPFFFGLLATSEAPALFSAFGRGDEAYKKESASFASDLGAFTLGSRASEKLVGGFLAPFEGEGGKISRKEFAKQGKAGAEFAERYSVAEKASKLDIKPSKVNLSQAERVTTKTAKVTETFLRNNKGVVLGGSTAQAAQTPKALRTTKPSDVDLYSKNAKSVATKLYNKLKASGVDVRMDKDPDFTTYRIYETVKGQSQKAIEVHDITQLKQNIGEVRGLFETSSASIVKDPTGISILSFATQAKRKVIGGTFDPMRTEKDIGLFESSIRPAIEGGYFEPKKSFSLNLQRSFKAFVPLNQTGFGNLGVGAGGTAPKGGKLPVSKPTVLSFKPSSSGVKIAPTKYVAPVSFKETTSAVKVRTAPTYYGGYSKPVEKFGVSGVGISKPSVSSAVVVKPSNYVPFVGTKKPTSYGVSSKPSNYVPFITPEKSVPYKPPTKRTTYTPFIIPSKTPTYKPPTKRPPYVPFITPSKTPIYRPPAKPPTYRPPYQPPYTPTYRPPYAPPRRTPAFLKFKPKGEEVFGYKVFVRGKGKKTKTGFKSGEFIQATKGVLSRKEALAFGQSLVSGTAKRTFKIVPTVGKRAMIKRIPKFRSEMFRTKGRTFIEKSRFAIDTSGERKAITQAGISKLQGLRLTGFTKVRKKTKRKKVKKKKTSKKKRKGR